MEFTKDEQYAQNAGSSAINLDSLRATIVLVCLVAALSYVAPRLQSALMLNLQTAWPLWPGCAILVAVLMLVRTSIWPALILVSFVGFILFDLHVGVPVRSIVWFIPADAIQVLVPQPSFQLLPIAIALLCVRFADYSKAGVAAAISGRRVRLHAPPPAGLRAA